MNWLVWVCVLLVGACSSEVEGPGRNASEELSCSPEGFWLLTETKDGGDCNAAILEGGTRVEVLSGVLILSDINSEGEVVPVPCKTWFDEQDCSLAAECQLWSKANTTTVIYLLNFDGDDLTGETTLSIDRADLVCSLTALVEGERE